MFPPSGTATPQYDFADTLSERYDTVSAVFCKGVYTIVTEIMKCGYICVAVFPRGEAHAFFTRGIAFFRENMVRIG